MAGTLYAALVMHSYVMSLICCAAQVRSCPTIGQHLQASGDVLRSSSS